MYVTYNAVLQRNLASRSYKVVNSGFDSAEVRNFGLPAALTLHIRTQCGRFLSTPKQPVVAPFGSSNSEVGFLRSSSTVSLDFTAAVPTLFQNCAGKPRWH